MRIRALMAGALVLTAGLAGCGETEGEQVDGTDGSRATAALEEQRDDVRAATGELQAAAARALGGRVRSSTGQWRGCESSAPEEFGSFRYQAAARIDAGAHAPRPYVDVLATVLADAGFTVAERRARPGGTVLPGQRGESGLGATFSELPEHGDYVLLTVAGPCVEVPEPQRAAWLGRDEPAPRID